MVDIENAALLVALFGHWPDFHDGEIQRLRVDASDHRDPALEIDFKIAEKSAEVDERGYYKDRQRAYATLRFENVGSLRLEGVFNQNVLGELRIEAAGPNDFDEVLGADDPRARRRYRVDRSSAIGMAGSFICDQVSVVRAEACAPLPNDR